MPNNKYLGLSKTNPLFATFHLMHQRCRPGKQANTKYYFGRGIKICERWSGAKGFLNFIEDMGPKPIGFSLDRIDNDADYSPENCRWANHYTQMANTRGAGLTPGVTWSKHSKKWRARIKIKGKEKHLGLFENKDKALKARQKCFIELQLH